jgi:hypothetical protein
MAFLECSVEASRQKDVLTVSLRLMAFLGPRTATHTYLDVELGAKVYLFLVRPFDLGKPQVPDDDLRCIAECATSRLNGDLSIRRDFACSCGSTHASAQEIIRFPKVGCALPITVGLWAGTSNLPIGVCTLSVTNLHSCRHIREVA